MNFADILARYFREKGIIDWEGTTRGAIELLKDYPVSSGPSGRNKVRQTIPTRQRMFKHLNNHPSFRKIHKENAKVVYYRYEEGCL